MQNASNRVIQTRLHSFTFSARCFLHFTPYASMTPFSQEYVAATAALKSRIPCETNVQGQFSSHKRRFPSVDDDGLVIAPNLQNSGIQGDPATSDKKIIPLNSEKVISTARACAHYLTVTAGAVLALPTDTVYGLACLGNDETAINRIYALKGRDLSKPLAVCVGNIGVINSIACADHIPLSLLEKLLPGPVTVVLKRSRKLSEFVNPGNELVGIRIIPLPFMQVMFEFLEEFLHAEGKSRDEAIMALTSANKSGDSSTVSIEEFRHLWDGIDLIVDGSCADGIRREEIPYDRQGSTVVNLSEIGIYRIIREGTNCDETIRTLESFNLKTC